MSQKFFQLIPSNTHIDFIGKAKYIFTFSGLLMIACLVSLLTRGLNYNVDFLGGTQIQLRFNSKPGANEVRKVLTPLGLSDAMVQNLGDQTGEFLIRVQPENLNLQIYQDVLQKIFTSVSPDPSKTPKIQLSEERLYVTFDSEVSEQSIFSALQQGSIQPLEVESVSRFGQAGSNEYLVQFSGVASRVIHAFKKEFGQGSFEVLQIEQVGAKVGSELRMQAFGAMIISILLMLVYVWFRFDLEFAPGAIIALTHDALVVLGFFSFFQVPFDLSIVAAVLTIVGFSVNDTIVIYDRVRENMKKLQDVNFPALINESVNETLSRTILTTGSVFLTVLALLFLGGPVTFNFALAFLIGLISGTYSTVYVASPMTIYIRNYLQRKRRV